MLSDSSTLIFVVIDVVSGAHNRLPSRRTEAYSNTHPAAAGEDTQKRFKPLPPHNMLNSMKHAIVNATVCQAHPAAGGGCTSPLPKASLQTAFMPLSLLQGCRMSLQIIVLSSMQVFPEALGHLSDGKTSWSFLDTNDPSKPTQK